MPVPLRTTYQKAEAKYNVTTEFTSLGLHHAAATGNVGLAGYALDHGQPINSVLDGVLPLHAACAGGNVQVVKLLIDHGADVNAPRLPRRYSNDKNRDTSVPIVGTSGSTPLHFAAANGNTAVVTLLLLHGAHANRPDKHGVTPETLARQNGWLECAEVLKQWLVNKDRDLRERPGGSMDDASGFGPDGSSNRERSGSLNIDGEPSSFVPGRRRIHVKQSIDTALNLLKSSSTDLRPQLSSYSSSLLTPPASPSKALADEDAFSRIVPPDSPNSIDGGRPSLPHILHPSSSRSSHSRKISPPTQTGNLSPQRPSSTDAGSDGQEQDLSQTPGSTGRIRKLGSKYSLMNIFKKAQASEAGQSLDGSQSTPGMTSPASGSSLTLSTSPKFPNPLGNVSPEVTLQNSQSGLRVYREDDLSMRRPSQQSLRSKEPPASSTSPRNGVPLAVDLHNAIIQERQERHTHHRPRDRSRSGSAGRFNVEDAPKPSPSPSSSPLARLGILRGQDYRRDRSGSSGSSKIGSSPHRGGVVFDEDLSIVPGEGASDGPESRSHLLKAHNRTSSAGQVPGSSSGFRPLRFDPSSGVSGAGQGDTENGSVTQVLRTSSSVGSIPKYRRAGTLGLSTSRLSEEDFSPDSAPATVNNFGRPRGEKNNNVMDEGEEDDEHEYGQPIIRPGDNHVIDPDNADLKSPRVSLLMRERGSSFTSSDSSLSPILSNDPQGASLVDHTEFPFSINTPPPVYPEETEGAGNQELLQVPPRPGSSRDRGNSVSSISTSDSRHNPSLSASGTTSGSGGSDTINTPWFSSPGREAFLNMPADSSVRYAEGLTPEDVRDQASAYLKPRNLNGIATPLHERRQNIPPDINISSISTHAQAEALVQRVQQDILEMAPAELSTGASSNGRSPLSARLAAYGESLALERRFREQKGIDQGSLLSAGVGSTPPSTAGLAEPKAVGDSPRQNGVERQHSLDHRNRPRFKNRMPTRPSTAEGLSPRLGDKPFGDFAARFHSPRSASGTSPPSRLTIEQDLSLLDDQYRGPGISPRFSTKLHDSSLADGRFSHTNGGSSESLDADTELGPSIYRTSTAPLGPARGSKATATKLTKMGFPSTEQARNPPPKRFGAIRSLVQTLKGKP